MLPLPPRTIERWLVRADTMPWGAFYRIAMGSMTAALYARWSAPPDSGWGLAAWFVVVLVALRVVPAIVRKLLPFSSEASAIWVQRRILAKRFDSYQWQKLLWFGIGMLAIALASPQFGAPLVVLTAFCLAGGAIGLALWRRHVAAGEAVPSRANERH